MIDEKTKKVLNDEGIRLSKILPGFYGKIAFNFFNGKCANYNVEQTIRKEDLDKRSKNG